MFGLGFTSVFEQVLEGLPEADKEAIFTSYIRALEEDPAQYKQVSTPQPKAMERLRHRYRTGAWCLATPRHQA